MSKSILSLFITSCLLWFYLIWLRKLNWVRVLYTIFPVQSGCIWKQFPLGTHTFPVPDQHKRLSVFPCKQDLRKKSACSVTSGDPSPPDVGATYFEAQLLFLSESGSYGNMPGNVGQRLWSINLYWKMWGTVSPMETTRHKSNHSRLSIQNQNQNQGYKAL